MSLQRKRKSALNTAVFLAAFLGVLVFINLISVKRFVRADLTEGNQHTLSEASKALVGGLVKPLVVKAYLSKDLQPPNHTLEQRVRDLLEEYKAYSNGQMTYEIKTPEDTEEGKDEALGFGINPVRADYVAETKVELRQVYKGIAFVSQDQQEVLGNLKPYDNLEYDFSSAIKRVISDGEKKSIGFLGGQGELVDMEGVIRAFNQIFGDQYEVKKVSPADGTPISEDLDALVIMNPQQMVPERVKYEVDQYLMRGGAVGLFIATQSQDRRFPIPRAQPVTTNLEPMMEHYGVQVFRQIILDRKNNTQMLVPTPEGLAIVNNPLAFVTRDLNKEHILTKNLGALALPYSSPLEIGEKLKAQEGAQIDVLVKSMEGSRAAIFLTDVSPEKLYEEQAGERDGPFDVAVAVVGQFTSFFEGKSVPQPTSQPAAGAAPSERPFVGKSPEGEARSRLFVMGNGEFLVQQNRMQRTAVIFLQNLVDWLVADEALIAIRSKGTARPLDAVEGQRKDMLTYANVLGVPLLFCLFGLLRWTLRRRRSVDLWAEAESAPDTTKEEVA